MAAIAVLAAAAGPALAGRPMTVDDANTNDRGGGHVEAWIERAGGATALTVAPAYAPFDGLEFAAAFSRDTTHKVNAQALQAKWRITESRDDGCNLGVSFGIERAGGGGDRARFANGLVSCNAPDLGSAHVNLGLVKASGAASVRTWGVAVEREFGAVTPHLEFFGEAGARPTAQVGARAEVSKGVQLDGTWGRQGGANLYSLGLKVEF